MRAGDMVNDFFRNNPFLLLLVGIILNYFLGLYLERSLRMKELARITWIFGVLVFSIAVTTCDWLGWGRWILSLICLVGGVYYVVAGRNKSRLN
jgi:hypothetical protein